MVSKYSRIKSKKSPNGDLVPTGDTPILIKLCSFTHNNASIRDIERNAFWHKLKAKGYTYSQISYIVNAPWQTVVSGIRTYELKKKEGALNVSKAE